MNSHLSSTIRDSEGKDKTVIVLDEQLFYRDILVRLLDAQSGLMVVAQADFSEKSFEEISKLDADLVLADPCANPEVCLAFIEQLLVLRKDIAVMLIASPCSTETFVRLICAGVSGVFLKTQGFDILLKAIKRVLAGELWFERNLIKTIVGSVADFSPKQIATSSNLESLSKRERQIVELVADGLNTPMIANTLHISEKTVRNHIYSIYGKLEVSDRLTLAQVVSKKSPK